MPRTSRWFKLKFYLFVKKITERKRNKKKRQTTDGHVRRRITVWIVERSGSVERHECVHVIAEPGGPGGGLSPPTAATATTPPPATTAAAAATTATTSPAAAAAAKPLATSTEPTTGPQPSHDAELFGPSTRGGRPSFCGFRPSRRPSAASSPVSCAASRRQRPQLCAIIARIVAVQLSDPAPSTGSAVARSLDRSALDELRLFHDPSPAIDGCWHDDGRGRRQ
jgi:hypothetical protein